MYNTSHHLLQWISDYSLPLLDRLSKSNFHQYLAADVPLAILYVASANDWADGDAFTRLAELYSFGIKEMCDDCRDLAVLEPDTDCTQDCRRQVLDILLLSNAI
jgi:hypothetical protein